MPDASAPAQASQVKSATRTLDIIEFLVAQGRPVVAQEIAVALEIPVSSLSYLLATLVERSYLAREGRRYSPGPGLERLQAHGSGPTLAQRAAPLVRTVRSQLNETTSFFVTSGWQVEALVTESSEHALRYSIVAGQRLPLHALAGGKALLAAMSDAELDRYFDESERGRFTPATVTSEKALRRELAEVRETGFALTDEEFSLGIRGIGRVVTLGDAAVGSLSVGIPKARCDPQMQRRAMELLERVSDLTEQPSG